MEAATKIWTCKIGERPVDEFKSFPNGSDSPMRKAAAEAYRAITGHDPDFIFSGWGGELTEPERAVVENRPPRLPAASPDALRVRELIAKWRKFGTEETTAMEKCKRNIQDAVIDCADELEAALDGKI